MTLLTKTAAIAVRGRRSSTKRVVVGGLLIVGGVYLGANPNNKRAGAPISSSAHMGTGTETTGSGNNSR
jgi:hypothetical protein